MKLEFTKDLKLYDRNEYKIIIERENFLKAAYYDVKTATDMLCAIYGVCGDSLKYSPQKENAIKEDFKDITKQGSVVFGICEYKGEKWLGYVVLHEKDLNKIRKYKISA